ncbi:MAG: hypothetical protein O3A40_08950 [Bacteroidetes bacterium]|nr:hypothetical protein [Bacteroidota bacterium]
MKILMIIGSLISLILTIVPPIIFFVGNLELSQMKGYMGIGMVLWFVTAPFWINKPSKSQQL